MSRLGALLLDLDGTVLDTHGLILSSWAHLRATFGLAGDDDAFRRGIGRPLPELLRPWATAELPVERLVAEYRAHNDLHHDAAVRVFDGVREVFDAARVAGVPVAIVTSKSRPFAERGLRVAGLRADALVGPTDAARPKPAPDPVWLALELLGGVPRDRALFVGDATTDLDAGRAAGVRTGAALWGPFSRDELAPSAPDLWLTSPHELLPLLA